MSDQSSSGNVGSGGNVRDEAEGSNGSNTINEGVSDERESIGGVDGEFLAVPISSDSIPRLISAIRKEFGSPADAIVSSIPIRTDTPSVNSAVTINLNEQLTIGVLVAHYINLLFSGYRATRWEHPVDGTEELTPKGWKFLAAHPLGKTRNNRAFFLVDRLRSALNIAKDLAALGGLDVETEVAALLRRVEAERDSAYAEALAKMQAEQSGAGA